eukprot:CAMPEP_0119304670 /NCGR_PEP_ID=MMETSP1333-20130426/5830_1 /TAXON_ID=418940 /ORGANISM="Scyphosphaera apsteinii, Strain RCC1455" /LENGTH=160 /DNA_ID=CAMNT_0007307591 /DNA_START=197 /DNA_END=679 /DNA_ORIENTATION=-
MFARAARQLGVDTNVVERGMNALCHILTRAAALAAPPECLVDGLDVTLPADVLCKLQEAYAGAAPLLGQLVSDGLQLPMFHSLEWRLQVQLAGRYAPMGECRPSFLLRLHTREGESGAKEQTHLLQADVSNLRHLTSELEAALLEEKSAYTRRISRRLRS